ncbi:unnamed protein product [Hymenolepis diminuta]|uniref:Dynein heavy chain tail domain-containing protein n=1 Tax=Hymenolepis diminuta TaxID=6216 RepID=A0A564Y5J6_HYMDI|nr:unnamed protein product [Hymenolepis diminuta]
MLLLKESNRQTVLNGSAFFFLRASGKEITRSNVADEIIFQFHNAQIGGLIDTAQLLLQDIYVPAFANNQSWGNLENDPEQKRQLINGFMDITKEYLQILEQIKDGSGLNFLSTPSKDDKGLIERIEENGGDLKGLTKGMIQRLDTLLAKWNKQVQLAVNELNLIIRESDNAGPADELAYWRSRRNTLTRLTERMASKEASIVTETLSNVKSASFELWSELRDKISDYAIEAESNVHFLSGLEKYFGSVFHNDPKKLKEEISALVNSIKVIFEVSEYFNTAERITSLFVKVTNQMVGSCRQYLYSGVEKIWSLPSEIVTGRIKECLDLYNFYRRNFQSVKKNLAANPDGRQLNCSENKIFGKFEAFCRRLSEISDLLVVIEGLRPISGLHADDTSEVTGAYQAMLDSVQQWKGDPIDPRNKQFAIDLQTFQSQRKDLLSKIDALLDKWLSRRLPAFHLLQFLSQWETRVSDPSLDFTSRYEYILRVYGQELEHIRDIYEADKRAPPLERRMSPVAGRIRWSRALLQRIRQPLDAIYERCPGVLEIPEGQKQVKRFNQLATTLVKYEAVTYHKWVKNLETASAELLETPLLIQERGKFTVNPLSTTLTIIQESQNLHKLGLKVPKVAMDLLLQEMQLKQHIDRLKENMSRFESLQLLIFQEMVPIFKPFLNAVEKSLYPGAIDITWNSMQFDNFIKDVEVALDKFEFVMKQTKDILECRIKVLLAEMSTISPLDINSCSDLSVDEFLQRLRGITPSISAELNK